MEWIIGFIFLALAARFGVVGLTGGMVLASACSALVVGVQAGSSWMATCGGLFLIASAIGAVRAATGDDQRANSSRATMNMDHP